MENVIDVIADNTFNANVIKLPAEHIVDWTNFLHTYQQWLRSLGGLKSYFAVLFVLLNPEGPMISHMAIKIYILIAMYIYFWKYYNG